MSFTVPTAPWWQQNVVPPLPGEAVKLTTGYQASGALNETVIASRIELLQSVLHDTVQKKRNFRQHGGPLDTSEERDIQDSQGADWETFVLLGGCKAEDQTPGKQALFNTCK